MTTVSTNVEARVIDAIHEHKLAEVAASILCSERKSLDADAEALVEASAKACQNIARHSISEARAICQHFADDGIQFEFEERDPELWSRQYHLFVITLKHSDPTAAVNIATEHGYRIALATNTAPWEAYRRARTEVTLTKTDTNSTRLQLRWSYPASRFAKRIWDRSASAYFSGYPAWLWPLAFAAKPMRLAAKLAGLEHRREPLGPFLGTPHSLIEPLLEFAGVSSNDVLLDLGCGDGRIIIEAARTRGCKGIGYELDKSLCELAKGRAQSQSVSGFIQVHQGDASAAQVVGVSVIFLFVPVETMKSLIPSLLKRMAPGARIIVHEQSPLACDPPPDKSRPLISDSAITVAHVWSVTELQPKVQ